MDTPNKIRLAWWGAEEQGLIGSTEYVAGLSKRATAKIALYLNFDMIGSPNFARLIYDGDGSAFDIPGPEGSDKIEKTFTKHFKREDSSLGDRLRRSLRLPPVHRCRNPRGGLFTGAEEIKTPEEQELFGGAAGVAFDPCYHQACDTVDNVSRKALGQMAPAVADAVARYAISTDSLGGARRAARAARTAPLRSRPTTWAATCAVRRGTRAQPRRAGVRGAA